MTDYGRNIDFIVSIKRRRNSEQVHKTEQPRFSPHSNQQQQHPIRYTIFKKPVVIVSQESNIVSNGYFPFQKYTGGIVVLSCIMIYKPSAKPGQYQSYGESSSTISNLMQVSENQDDYYVVPRRFISS